MQLLDQLQCLYDQATITGHKVEWFELSGQDYVAYVWYLVERYQEASPEIKAMLRGELPAQFAATPIRLNLDRTEPAAIVRSK